MDGVNCGSSLFHCLVGLDEPVAENRFGSQALEIDDQRWVQTCRTESVCLKSTLVE